jgi:hypothetical protein
MPQEPSTEKPEVPAADTKLERLLVLRALGFSAVVQGCLYLFSGLILDGGNLNNLVGITMIFFWSAVLSVTLVRMLKPRAPSGFDIALIKYGFLGLLVLMPFLDALADVVKNRLGLLS